MAAEEKKAIIFQTVEIGRTPGLKHLEQWPAGVTLCGIDMFPPDGLERPCGFSRGGGRSDWSQPCGECIRYARRFRSQCEIEIACSFGDVRRAFHDLITGGLADAGDAEAQASPTEGAPVAATAISRAARQDLAAEAARRAAPAFAAAGWEWRDIGVPDVAAIAASIAPDAESIDFEGSRSCGRLHVIREIDNGYETIGVSLDLASVTVELPGEA